MTLREWLQQQITDLDDKECTEQARGTHTGTYEAMAMAYAIQLALLERQDAPCLAVPVSQEEPTL